MSKRKQRVQTAPAAPQAEAPQPGQYVKPEKLARRKVALVGFCGNTRHLVDELWGHPEFEIWGLNRGATFMPEKKCHRWFETHSKDIYSWGIRRHPKHIEWLRNFQGPVYLHEYDPEIPNSVAYPLAEVAANTQWNCFRILMDGPGAPAHKDAEGRTLCEEQTRRPYLTSTIAYQIGLAMLEGFEEIHLYGIDLNTDGEYAWQKDGVEYLLGRAAERGIRVVIPDDAALLKGKLYGRGFMKPEGEKLTMHQFEMRKKSLETQIQQAAAQYHQAVGRRQQCEEVCEQMPPGLDAEKLDQELRQRKQQEQQAESIIRNLEGRLHELAYWIQMTPEGQPGDQAIQQIEAARAAKAAEAAEPAELPEAA